MNIPPERPVFSPYSPNRSSVPALLKEMGHSLLAVVYPSDCVLCGAELPGASRMRICPVCWQSLTPWGGVICCRCGLPFVSPRALDARIPQCGDCRNHVPAFDAARSFALYLGKLRRAILRLKFSGDETLGGRLGSLLLRPWDGLLSPGEFMPAIIVPVPLHPSRRRERGFNQSELLANGLVRELKRRGSAPRVVTDCLHRRRATPPQTGLSVSARRDNLRGAFEVARRQAISDQCVVLVDDVMTTGATLSACARALKRAGSKQVLGLTLARATPLFPDLSPSDDNNPVDGLDWDST